MASMRTWLTLIVVGVIGVALGCGSGEAAHQTPLAAGVSLTRSGSIRPGTYLLPANGDQPVIRIVGDNLTIDFKGAVLCGSPESAMPDEYAGTAIAVSGSNITLKNVLVRGYKVGLMATDSPSLHLTGCDFSYNWKQHLKSTLEREDGADWMSFHNNENDEWLRYGAGVYLKNCPKAQVDQCTIMGGQNGLMLRQCDDGKIYNNDFSFLSGLGLGMYRSSRNVVMHNKIDFCVRGYSHGVYSRGQDSAGILVYEQSCNNTFAYNSATHGGDGFFLWAGQSTMDSGQGGCNDNLLYANDLSCAPANAIEATFSRNKFIRNRLEESDHGIWGGYSYDTLILGNTIANNTRGVSIEHGQNNTIAYNLFVDNPVHIEVWQNARQDPNWGYPKNRDTRSRGYEIQHNQFGGGKTAIVARESQKIMAAKNVATSELTAANLQGGTENKVEPLVKEEAIDYGALADYRVQPMAKGQDAMLPAGHPRGRKYILVDEWGPYDFKSPKLWLRQGMDKERKMRFEILGPAGSYRVIRSDGAASVLPASGSVPGTLEVTLAPGAAIDLNLTLVYTGKEVTTPLGKKIAAGEAVRFSYRKFQIPMDWAVKFYKWDKDSSDPRTQAEAFYKILGGQAIKEEKVARLDYSGVGAVAEGLPGSQYAAVAEAPVAVPQGEYSLEVTSDDGVRVYVDGKRVIDNWTWHVPTLDKAELKLSGKHRIRVEYFQIDGYATLKLDLMPKR